ncbi:MAG: FHA domain-containing protein [Verrucomicrobiales bacterium]
MSSLFITHSDGSETEVPLGEETLRIGRAPENEIALDDSSVSTFHAEIHRDGDHHVLKDLGSTNGVRLNGERVQEAHLSDGDLLRFGNLRAHYQGAPRPAAPSSTAEPASEPEAPREGGAHAPPPAAIKPSASTVPDIKPLGFGPKKTESNPDKIIAAIAGVIVVLTAAAAALMAFSMR